MTAETREPEPDHGVQPEDPGSLDRLHTPLAASPSDSALPPSRQAEGAPPPPPSFFSSASSSFTSYMSRVPVPSFFSGAHSHVAQYMERLPRSASEQVQGVIAAASSAVHSPDADSPAAALYVTPFPDCCTLERMVFVPSASGVEPLPAESELAAKKTVGLGAVLCAVGLLMIIFPSLPTRAIVLLASACLVVVGIVTLLSFILTAPSSGSYVFLCLAVFDLAAGLWMLWSPMQAAFSLVIVIAAWLVAKGVGRLSAWRNFQGADAPPFWRAPHKSGLTLLVLGALLMVFSRFALYLLGIVFGWDILLTGMLIAAAGLHSWRTNGATGSSESDPLVHHSQHHVPPYTV